MSASSNTPTSRLPEHLASIPEVLTVLRSGKPVIVADDENRENEGDAIMAAEFATPQWIAWMVRHTSGFLCAPLTNEIADRLRLPLLTEKSEDPRQTAYTISVDAADRISTGISATDRAHTLRTLADPAATAESLIRPGHILPLRAVPGGVRQRPGHTEATIELLRLAGLRPVGVIGELVSSDGEMMRLPELLRFGGEESLPVTTVSALTAWLDEHPGAITPSDDTPEQPRVSFEVETTIPTTHGPFQVRAYRDQLTGADHLALIAGQLGDPHPIVRVHSECLTGDAFGSLKCECGPQLNAALETIQRDGGVVIYLRGQEGRGIGLINKLRAYRLQENGLDTLEANLALGLPADARDYGAAAAILNDLKIRSIRLLTNNPEKVAQLTKNGVQVSEQIPLVVGVGAYNRNYLRAKRDRMGHSIPTETLDSGLTSEVNLLLKGHPT